MRWDGMEMEMEMVWRVVGAETASVQTDRQTQELGNGRRRESHHHQPFGAGCQYIDARLSQHSSWGCSALLARSHRPISRAYCGTTSLRVRAFDPGARAMAHRPWDGRRFSFWPSFAASDPSMYHHDLIQGPITKRKPRSSSGRSSMRLPHLRGFASTYGASSDLRSGFLAYNSWQRHHITISHLQRGVQ